MPGDLRIMALSRFILMLIVEPVPALGLPELRFDERQLNCIM